MTWHVWFCTRHYSSRAQWARHLRAGPFAPPFHSTATALPALAAGTGSSARLNPTPAPCRRSLCRAVFPDTGDQHQQPEQHLLPAKRRRVDVDKEGDTDLLSAGVHLVSLVFYFESVWVAGR